MVYFTQDTHTTDYKKVLGKFAQRHIEAAAVRTEEPVTLNPFYAHLKTSDGSVAHTLARTYCIPKHTHSKTHRHTHTECTNINKTTKQREINLRISKSHHDCKQGKGQDSRQEGGQ